VTDSTFSPQLAAARRRYHRLPISDRPALSDPRSYCGLFDLGDLVALAKASCWPLPPEALRYLAEPPRARARRGRRLDRRIAAVVRDVLAAELPEAIAAIGEVEGRSAS
jgi:hypothetical protein